MDFSESTLYYYFDIDLGLRWQNDNAIVLVMLYVKKVFLSIFG